jgi:hypothetical protein
MKFSCASWAARPASKSACASAVCSRFTWASAACLAAPELPTRCTNTSRVRAPIICGETGCNTTTTSPVRTASPTLSAGRCSSA